MCLRKMSQINRCPIQARRTEVKVDQELYIDYEQKRK